MNTELLESVMKHLRTADEAVAQRVHDAFGQFLHQLVRRHLPTRLRSKLDSVDIVQSVWADLIRGFQANRWDFEDEARLRAFLVRAARNRIVDRYRQYHTPLEKEQTLIDSEPVTAKVQQASPSDIVQADDLWERMLGDCSPTQREVLMLKRQGYSLTEITARTGLHSDSVRRILRKIAKSVAVKPRPSGRSS